MADAPMGPNNLDSIKQFMDEDGRLTSWPRKYSRKLIAADYLAMHFSPGVIYSESQVNDILEDWHTFNDAAVLRRFLIDLGIMKRDKDGRRYWLAGTPAIEIAG
jgi:hypothetical protein